MPLPQSLKTPEITPLDELLTKAANNKINNLPYAGELLPEEVYSYLQENEGVLVDVRTQAEWQFVGIPDISGTRGSLALISWKNYPGFTQNMQFAESLAGVKNITKDTPLFFICRSGGRSLDAAVAMSAAGYFHCFNVTHGFEGEPDIEGQRGNTHGWKFSKLPWRQG